MGDEIWHFCEYILHSVWDWMRKNNFLNVHLYIQNTRRCWWSHIHFIRIPITYSVVEKCVTHIGSFAKRERILRTNIKAYTPEAISYLPPFHRERGLQNLEICHFINNWVTESCNLCWASVRCLNILLLCIIYYYLWSLVLVYEPGHIISSS